MTAQEMLAEGALGAKQLLVRFLDGFNEENRLQRAENLPNHLMWCLGHTALYLNRMAEQWDGQPLPEADFVSGDGTAGTAERFDSEAVAFGTDPSRPEGAYPTLTRGRAIYEAACDRLAAAARAASDADLAREIDWLGTTMPLHALAVRVLFHSGLHTGQITDLRRALGMGRVIR
jgi:hypothetical protein